MCDRSDPFSILRREMNEHDREPPRLRLGFLGPAKPERKTACDKPGPELRRRETENHPPIDQIRLGEDRRTLGETCAGRKGLDRIEGDEIRIGARNPIEVSLEDPIADRWEGGVGAEAAKEKLAPFERGVRLDLMFRRQVRILIGPRLPPGFVNGFLEHGPSSFLDVPSYTHLSTGRRVTVVLNIGHRSPVDWSGLAIR